MAKLPEDMAIALALASLRSGLMGDPVTRQRFKKEMYSRVLMKLGEECAELSQAILKSMNPASGAFGNHHEVEVEAGHVMLFLEIANSFSNGVIRSQRTKRVLRHLDEPKCKDTALMETLKDKIPEILSWLDKE